MIRVLNFLCVALMGLSILALYHVSEQTRVVHMALGQVNRNIVREQEHLTLLETEWQHDAAPDKVQRMAQERLGMTDAASVQFTAFDQLPRRGEDAPLNNSPVHNASAQLPAQPAAPMAVSSDSGM